MQLYFTGNSSRGQGCTSFKVNYLRPVGNLSYSAIPFAVLSTAAGKLCITITGATEMIATAHLQLLMAETRKAMCTMLV